MRRLYDVASDPEIRRPAIRRDPSRVLARNRIADAFDLLCEIAEPFDAMLIRMWRWLTHTYAGGIILIGIAVMDILTLLLLFWKP